MFELRPYQKDQLMQVKASMARGNRVIVVQNPPRTGKTVEMAEIARLATEKGNNVLFLIHREEVLDQAKSTFKSQGVKMSKATMEMVQTITRHVDQLPEIKLILVDEAHHALAKTYQRIFKANPNAYILLFTATPRRTGKDQLDKLATDMVVGKQIQELINLGWLAPFDYYAAKDGDIDQGELKKSSTGEFTSKSISKALKSHIYSHTVDEYLKHANGLNAVAYTHNVDSAKKLAKEFTERGISAAEVDAKTPEDQRDKIVQDFRNGKIKILVNVNLFTEGVDLPNVDCVLMVRPTESLSLYLQFAMRCLNPRPGKKAVIIDQVDNYKRHGLPNAYRDWFKLMHSTGDEIKTVECRFCHRLYLDQEAKAIEKEDNRCEECGEYPLIGHQCRNCGEWFATENIRINNNHCPGCGYHPFFRTGRQAPEHVDQELTKIDQGQEIKKETRLAKMEKLVNNNVARNIRNKSIHELSNYKEFEMYGKLHGYKKGWAWVQWQKKIKGGY